MSRPLGPKKIEVILTVRLRVRPDFLTWIENDLGDAHRTIGMALREADILDIEETFMGIVETKRVSRGGCE